MQKEIKSQNKMRLCDFITYNPPDNKMSTIIEPVKIKRNVDETAILNETIEESCEELGVPQVKIGPNGDIILDETSLTIENPCIKATQKLIASKPILIEKGFSSYSSLKRKYKTKTAWSKEETLKFYKALNTIGTDFSVMGRLFPKRDRNQLKLKFKHEERKNPRLIEKALQNPLKFDIEKLEDDLELANIKNVNKKIKFNKTLKKIKKKASYYGRLIIEDDGEDDPSNNTTVSL